MRRNWIKYSNIFLCAVAAFVLVNIFLFVRSYGKEKADASVLPVSETPELAVKAEKSLSDYAVIYKRNLFNISDAPKPVSTSSASASLKLKGTVVGAEEFTFCIIEDKTKRKDDLYQKGDKIQDMEVTEIMANSVILARGAEKIILYIDEENKDVMAGGTAVSAVAVAKTEFAGFPSLENPEPNTWVLSREDVIAASRNVSQIMSDFKIKPNFSSGRMEGFRIEDVSEGSIALAMGIRKGDVIKKINGEALDSPKKIFDFYRNLDKSSVFQVEVSRGDATETLTYEIKQ